MTWNSGAQSAEQIIANFSFVQLAIERAFRGNCRFWGISENAFQFAVKPAASSAVKSSCEPRKEIPSSNPLVHLPRSNWSRFLTSCYQHHCKRHIWSRW